MASSCTHRVVTASPLVDAARLRSHLGARGLVVLDATVDKTADGRYVSGHAGFVDDGRIPGSRHADLIADFSDPQAPFPFTRPDAGAFEAGARALGICADSTVVVYDRRGGAWAARVWWLLRSFGHDDVGVLDGGLRAWVDAGGEVETGVVVPPRAGDFRATVRDGYFADTDAVRAAMNGDDPAGLVCALGRDVFEGRATVAGRAGHIPGSVNVPYPDLLDPTGHIDAHRVRAAVAELDRLPGRAAGRAVIGYCGGGINAAGLALALSVVGITTVEVYDGSLSEWNADPGNPLEIVDG